MKVKHPYNVALLDGDLLILTPPGYEVQEQSYSQAARETGNQESNALVQSILDRMYKRESELPYLFLQWAE